MAFQGYVTSQGDDENEQHDTAMSERLSAEYQIPLPSAFTFTGSTAAADTLCRDAGLTVDFPGLMAAAISVGRWPPYVVKSPSGDGDWRFRPGNDRQHLVLRAWAKTYAPSLIDAAALPRRRPAYGWW